MPPHRICCWTHLVDEAAQLLVCKSNVRSETLMHHLQFKIISFEFVSSFNTFEEEITPNLSVPERLGERFFILEASRLEHTVDVWGEKGHRTHSLLSARCRSTMPWGCFSATGAGTLLKVERITNEEKYLEILKENRKQSNRVGVVSSSSNTTILNTRLSW